MTVLGCSFALAGSQIVLLLYLTLASTIARDLDATSLLIWLLTAGIVAMGALAPFVGPLADLFGRKLLFLLGIGVSIVGAIVCATTPNVAGFLAGQVLLGFGAVIQELLSIAVVGEIVPTAKRPLYAAMILCGIIPWTPGTLYANWMAQSSWRWVGCALALWNVITLAILAYFYRPPPRVNSIGLSRGQMIRRIDFVGGLLSIAGLLFFLIGLGWGGQQYGWHSAHVLAFLIVGAVLIITFGLWEKFGAPYPMFPRRIIHAPRPFFCILFVIFAAGINYVALVVFWPIQSIAVYGADHYRNGINTLPLGTCILGGAIMSAILVGQFKKHITFLMFGFCVLQTVGELFMNYLYLCYSQLTRHLAAACLVLVDPHDVRTVFAPIVLSLIGTGGVLVPNQIIITIITPDDLIATVTALTVGLRAQSQVIGLAIFYNRFITEATKKAFVTIIPAMVKADIFSATVIRGLITNLTSEPYSQLAPLVPQLATEPNYSLVQESTIQCFSYALKLVYYITIPFGVAACIAAALMGDVSQFMDEHVAVIL